MTNPLFDNTNVLDPQDVDVETAKAALIGEGKKYKTPDDGIKALYHSQAHIARLERENAEAKAALAERKNAEDLLALIEQKLKTTNVETPPGLNNQQVPPLDTNKSTDTLSKEDIARLFDERFNVNKRQTVEEQNLNSVIKTLEENWGPGFKQDLKIKAQAMGVSEDYLLTLAKTTPQVFLSAVGGTVKRGSPTDSLPPRTSQRGIPANDNPSSGVNNKAFYDKMRRENPKQYFSSDVQVKMHNDALLLKEKFYS